MTEEEFNQVHTEFNTMFLKDGEYHSGRMNSAAGKAFKLKLDSLEIAGCTLLSEKIQAVRYNLFRQPLCSCGAPVKFNSNGKLQQFCSPKCGAVSNNTKELRARTNLEKYGVEHSAGSVRVQVKIADTNMKKYGSRSSWAAPEIRAKAAQTNLDRYGVVNAAQSSTVQDKMRETFAARTDEERAETLIKTAKTSLEKYGFDHHTKHPDGGAAISKRVKERFINTSFPEHIARIEREYNIRALFTAEDWAGYEARYKWRHLECNREFTAAARLSREMLCPLCRRKSKVQQAVEDMVQATGVYFESENRQVISPYELDVLIPEHNVAIEVNGVFWHHAGSPQLPLLHKTVKASAAGVHLLHFWDFEISENPSAVNNIILEALGQLPEIDSAGAQVKILEPVEVQEFFELYNLAGHAQADFDVGLVSDNVLIQAASFIYHGSGANQSLELIRISSAGISVRGGLQKILDTVQDLHPGMVIVHYADRRFYNSAQFLEVGFIEKELVASRRFYFAGKRLHAQADIDAEVAHLKEILEIDGDELTVMYAGGWLECTDCGSVQLEITLPTNSPS
jgi:very-short-patch-repair endonuclease